MEKLISIDLKAPMGFLKKPDINEGIYLTFNMLHKPVLLGILGAIAGLKGYQNEGELPEYFQRLKDLKIGIQPLEYDEKSKNNRGNFQKTTIKYNNAVGYANRDGGILNVVEQTLIKPVYRCFLLFDFDIAIHRRLNDYLQKYEAEFLPYLGKNEYSLWWEAYREYDYEPFSYDRDYKVATIFRKADQLVKEMRQNSGGTLFLFDTSPSEPEFLYFEELPVGFDEELMQYQRETFAYTNFTLRKEKKLEGLYYLKEDDVIIQLF